MTAINKSFFSARSMQDFLECPRRFELRYMLQQSWPAPVTEPVLLYEERIRVGNEFHRIIQKYLIGIELNRLLGASVSPEIDQWLNAFHSFFTQLQFRTYFSELPLIMPFNNMFFRGVVDFAGLKSDNKLLIADWKTTFHPRRKDTILKSIQSILYPFMIFECRDTVFPGWKGKPEDLKMIYWFADQPEEVISLDYSQKIHKKNSEILNMLVETIGQTEPGSFQKTDDTKKCIYCEYRSLCERGDKAGPIHELEDEIDLDLLITGLNFDDVMEIPI